MVNLVKTVLTVTVIVTVRGELDITGQVRKVSRIIETTTYCSGH